MIVFIALTSLGWSGVLTFYLIREWGHFNILQREWTFTTTLVSIDQNHSRDRRYHHDFREHGHGDSTISHVGASMIIVRHLADADIPRRIVLPFRPWRDFVRMLFLLVIHIGVY